MSKRLTVKDRVLGLERVRARDLKPNSLNWRTHPEKQRAALKAMLNEVGFAVPLVARKCEDGSLELIDGHLRAETMPDEVVPVVVLDVSRDEALKLLATIDPMSALAGRDQERLVELLSQVDSDSAAVQEMLASLVNLKTIEGVIGEDESDKVKEKFEILIDCEDEAQQRDLLDRFAVEGLKCRSLIT